MKCPVLECPCPANCAPRSLEQHRRYFKMISLAFENWPETHERQFADAEECRKYLQMKAGWFREAARMPSAGMSQANAIMLAEAMFRAAGNYAIATIKGRDLVVYAPKSIAFAKLKHNDACRLFDRVSEVIGVEIGIDGNTLLERQSEVA